MAFFDTFFEVVAPDISVDVGSSTTPILISGQRRIYSESTYLAYDKIQQRMVAVGSAAKSMIGRSLPSIEIIRPVREGVIADFDGAEFLLKHMLRIVNPKGIMAPRMVVGVPSDASDVECRAAAESARAAGARSVYVIQQLLASAVGAGLPVLEAKGQMIVNIGGDTVQVGVVSMGELIVSENLRWGSGRFDERILTFLRNNYNHLVDIGNAEKLKIATGSAICNDCPLSGNICGLDLNSGLPKSISVNSNQIADILAEPLDEIAQLLKRVLEETPPELAEDIVLSGCVLCGGGALLRDIDTYLSKVTGIKCFLAPDPSFSVVMGAESILKTPRLLRTVMNRNMASL